MCTAATYKTKHHYFGRNFDYEISYGEVVTVTPRNFPFTFRRMPEMKSHYAMIGIATVIGGCPLYYDATNEKGLSMAGLNFPDNATYYPEKEGADNIAPFELIPWVLGQCENIAQVRALLSRLQLVNICFSEQLPLAPLHWIISDRDESITLETVRDGMKIYDNPVGVLTNNPTFDYHMTNLRNYMALSPFQPENHFAPALDLKPYSRGMGAMGLPGDLSSASRFVKAAFTKMNAVSDESEGQSVSQFFHILGSVAQQRGCVPMGEGLYEVTLYSSCCNTDTGVYYYTTYDNSQITAVDMHREQLDGSELAVYPLIEAPQIHLQNA